jgi:hypothetical protein
VDKLMDPTAAYIQMGVIHENGPVVAMLYKGCETEEWGYGNMCSSLWAESGHRCLAHGIIWARDLQGPLAGQPITALVALFHSHDAYVNVHTPCERHGAIRGQIW